MATDLQYFATQPHYEHAPGKSVLAALEAAHAMLSEAGVQADDLVSIQQTHDGSNFWTVSGWYRTRPRT